MMKPALFACLFLFPAVSLSAQSAPVSRVQSEGSRSVREDLLLEIREDTARRPMTDDPLVQEVKLTASDGIANDSFGNNVVLSSDGNTAFVGAPNKTVGSNPGQGAVYLFNRVDGKWVQVQELTASDGRTLDQFGRVALSSDGKTAFIGAPLKTVDSTAVEGAVYVFTSSGGIWSQQQELTASDGATVSLFGTAIALSSDGKTALIGSPQKTVSSNLFQGAVYVFTNSGGSWNQQQVLAASDGTAGDYFGQSLALSSDGKTALIGALFKEFGAKSSTGAVYAFTPNSEGSWSQQQELKARHEAFHDYFGSAVALSSDGKTALIGASGKIVDSNLSGGAAYVFANSGGSWTQQEELTGSPGAGQFGVSLALSSDGKMALVGANLSTVGSNNQQGSAYVFINSGGCWMRTQRLTASDGVAFDTFGDFVSLSSNGETALVGAFAENADQGAAYVFTSRPMCSGTSMNAAAENRN